MASAAEEELYWLVRLAETDASIRRLSQEVERTGRRTPTTSPANTMVMGLT